MVIGLEKYEADFLSSMDNDLSSFKLFDIEFLHFQEASVTLPDLAGSAHQFRKY